MCKIKKLYKNGFTLLELLVVVVIMGILAAIALPQYQLSVDKTKFTKLQNTAKEIADAYTRYHLATNDYPSDIKQLDIDFSEGNKVTYPVTGRSCVVFNDYYCCVRKPDSGHYGDVYCGNLDYSFLHTYRLFLNDYSLSSYRDCRAKAGNKRAERMCNNFSKVHGTIGINNIATPYGKLDGYTIYYKYGS